MSRQENPSWSLRVNISIDGMVNKIITRRRGRKEGRGNIVISLWSDLRCRVDLFYGVCWKIETSKSQCQGPGAFSKHFEHLRVDVCEKKNPNHYSNVILTTLHTKNAKILCPFVVATCDILMQHDMSRRPL